MGSAALVRRASNPEAAQRSGQRRSATTFGCVEAKTPQGSLEITSLDAKIRSIGE